MTIPLSVVLTSDNYEYTEFLGRVEDLEDAMHAQDFVVTTIILDVNWVTSSPYTLPSRRDDVIALQDRIRERLPWAPLPEAYQYFETRVSHTTLGCHPEQLCSEPAYVPHRYTRVQT